MASVVARTVIIRVLGTRRGHVHVGLKVYARALCGAFGAVGRKVPCHPVGQLCRLVVRRRVAFTPQHLLLHAGRRRLAEQLVVSRSRGRSPSRRLFSLFVTEQFRHYRLANFVDKRLVALHKVARTKHDSRTQRDKINIDSVHNDG